MYDCSSCDYTWYSWLFVTNNLWKKSFLQENKNFNYSYNSTVILDSLVLFRQISHLRLGFWAVRAAGGPGADGGLPERAVHWGDKELRSVRQPVPGSDSNRMRNRTGGRELHPFRKAERESHRKPKGAEGNIRSRSSAGRLLHRRCNEGSKPHRERSRSTEC